MDRLDLYPNRRPWTRSNAPDYCAESSKPMSKLDSAKLKLSKFKLKYGKQEKPVDVDSSLSSTDISSGKSSPINTNIPNRPSEKPDQGISSEVESRDGEDIERDSLMSVPRDDSQTPIKPRKQSSEEDSIYEMPVQAANKNFRDDSSISEILENVHSFSSIEIRSAIALNEFPLKPIDYSFNEVASGNKDEDYSFSSVGDILEELDSEKQDDVTLSSADHSLIEPESGKQSGDFKSSVGNSVEQLESGKENEDYPLKNVENKIELESRTQAEDFLLKPIQDNLVELKTGKQNENLSKPVESLKRNVSAIPEVLQSEGPKRNEASLGNTSSLKSKEKEALNLQNIVTVAQELHKSKSVMAKGIRGRTTPEKSFEDSSPTVIPPKKEAGQKNVHVQTDMKRSRAAQVSLSSTESMYERRSVLRSRTGRSCPILRAASLPHGLRAMIEEPFDFGGLEDAEQLFLHSQIQLTLNLLRREQNLYLNCSRAAARLERSYQNHALSDTRQERKLRKKLRRNGAKLEMDGSQPYREKK